MNKLPFEKKELKIEIHNPNHLPTIDFHELKELQGDLKITTPAKIEKLKKSIVKYGIFVPKFIWIENGTHYIEDGHQTIKALTELEKGGYVIPLIPYVEIQAKDRKEAGEKLLMINSRFADINPETRFFKDFDIGLEFMEKIEIPELELDFEGVGDEIVEDEVPEVPEEPVTQVGDLWSCGKHRVLCGDATKAEDVKELMAGKNADIVFTDPPYSSGGFQESGKTGGSIGTRGNKKIQNDQLSTRGYRNLMLDIFKLCKSVHTAFIFCDWKMWIETFDITERSGFRIRNMLVWDKIQMGMGQPYRNQHELIMFSSKIAGKIGEGTTANIFRIPRDKSKLHPTLKPVSLIMDIINPIDGKIVFDPFLGSATTLIAAHQLNRICYGMEIEPKYVDVACQRFFNRTGIDPIRDSDGKKWGELQQLKLDKT